MRRRIFVSKANAAKVASHPAMASFLRPGGGGGGTGEVGMIKEDLVLVTDDPTDTSDQFAKGVGGIDLICYKSAVFLLKLSDIQMGDGVSPSMMHSDNADDGIVSIDSALEEFSSSSAASSSLTASSRAAFLRRRFQQIAAARRNAPLSTEFVFMLLYCDVPQPDLAFLTWCNTTAIDTKSTLILVWHPHEAAAVFECLLSDAYNNAGHLQAAILTAGKPFSASFNPLSTSTSLLTSAGMGLSTKTTAEHLINAFSAIPTVQQTDTTRLLNETKTVAELLLSDPRVLVETIPQFTRTKAEKLFDVFNAEFPTTATRLAEVQNQLLDEAGAGNPRQEEEVQHQQPTEVNRLSPVATTAMTRASTTNAVEAPPSSLRIVLADDEDDGDDNAISHTRDPTNSNSDRAALLPSAGLASDAGCSNAQRQHVTFSQMMLQRMLDQANAGGGA